VKYRLHDSTQVEEQLRARGAVLVTEHDEEDHYLNGPDRDFARTDEAFRLRRIGEKTLLTYKGPRRDAKSKTRTEIEVACPPGKETVEAFLKLFRHLGYRFTAVVRKRRKIYELVRAGFTLHACLDDVDQVGRFIELEIVAKESERNAALECVIQVAAELGLTESEPRSYLEQLLGRAVTPGGER
jgi:adenylate cyclase class 2